MTYFVAFLLVLSQAIRLLTEFTTVMQNTYLAVNLNAGLCITQYLLHYPAFQFHFKTFPI